jgi:hypothetical protein
MFYYENTSLVLQSFREVSLSDKRPGTLVLLKPHCRETSVPGKMDKHFYACASLNLLMDECQLSLPSRCPSKLLCLYNYTLLPLTCKEDGGLACTSAAKLEGAR